MIAALAALPITGLTNPAISSISKKEFTCLVKNIYHEAGIEGLMGKLSVAQVTLNRTKHPRLWANTICGVVYQKKRACQFSWVCQGRDKEKVNDKMWADSLIAARLVLAGHVNPKTKHSMFYHADYISRPVWADTSKLDAKVGKHFFYSGAIGVAL